MDRYGVLVFHEQPFTDEEQIAFATRFDGELHAKTGISVLQKSRLGNEALTDISNLDEDGEVIKSDARRRMYSLGNRLWHTDASFQDPPGRYSMLHARVVPPVPADTQFADMRAAYDALSGEMKQRLEGLQVHHSIAYSRRTLGFEFSPEEEERLQGAIHPLVRTIPSSGRRSCTWRHTRRGSSIGPYRTPACSSATSWSMRRSGSSPTPILGKPTTL
jgi:alpha-ketoglutarate-dependent 2,4-dichlorophenoxyacetate dioxygenase